MGRYGPEERWMTENAQWIKVIRDLAAYIIYL